MRKLALFAALFAVAACDQPEPAANTAAAPAPTETAEDTVRRLYAMERPPSTQAEIESVFTTEFTPGLAPASGRSALNWDYRYDVVPSQVEPSDVTYVLTPRSRATARVTVNFKNKGVADTMHYDLCLRSSGQWRIRNIVDPDDGGGSLRPILGLGPVRGTECP